MIDRAQRRGVAIRNSGMVPLCIGSSIVRRSGFLGVGAVAGIIGIGSYGYSYGWGVLCQRSAEVTETDDARVGEVGGHVVRCGGWWVEERTWSVSLER